MQLNRTIQSKLRVIAIVTALSLSFTACSSMGGGSGTGDMNGGQDLTEYDLNAQREGRFGEGNIPAAEGEGVFRDVHFGYDSSEISDDARQAIEYNVQILKSNPDISITVEGHCDERGTAEYNLALGAERARAVEEILWSYGIPGDRVKTISYGEEVPLDNRGHEDAWSRNRRAHFSGYRDMAQMR